MNQPYYNTENKVLNILDFMDGYLRAKEQGLSDEEYERLRIKRNEEFYQFLSSDPNWDGIIF